MSRPFHTPCPAESLLAFLRQVLLTARLNPDRPPLAPPTQESREEEVSNPVLL